MTEIDRLLAEGFITEDFLKEEVRCDYVVPTSMKKAWAIQLDLLVKLFEVCQRNNLRVWVSGGTLLGAVRHKGFIPWDDDSDVFMPREDHDKLLKIATGGVETPYFIQSYLNDPSYPYPYARIRNSNTTVNEHRYKQDAITWNNGIFVDIFPLDVVDEINWKLRLKTETLIFYRKMLTNFPARELNLTKRGLIVHSILNLPFIPFNNQAVIKHMHKISSSRMNFDEADKVGLIMCSPYILDKNIYDKKDWDETIWLPFENIKVPAPKGWDNILRKTFGDYMKFPPVEKRGNWHALEFDAETPYKLVNM